MTSRLPFAACALAASLLAGGCATPSPADYAQERPALTVREYFNGRVDAYGMFQDRFGKVVKRFTVAVECSWKGDEGVLDESFVYSDGTRQKRIWKLKAQPDGRFTGTADDVVGVAQGEQSGNTIHWTYTLRQPIGEKVYEVQMDDWMYRVDERVVLNRTQMSKFGVRLGDATLSFEKKQP